jgi:diguanylate cyclase (GGDEF)-like protein
LKIWILTRYGGEYFIIMAPNTPSADGDFLAERSRGRIETHQPISEHGNIKLQLAVSIGVANLRNDIIDQENLNKNLYSAKDGGRNRAIAELPTEKS